MSAPWAGPALSAAGSLLVLAGVTSGSRVVLLVALAALMVAFVVLWRQRRWSR